MSSPTRPAHARKHSASADLDSSAQTVAAFSPSTSLHSHALAGSQRSTILIHEKSPLLVATPPQITRALAYSHPFLSVLNCFAGLVSWTTGDPWESFLVVATFWAVILYGDSVARWGGPLFVVGLLILAMYARRYSSLSSTAWTGQKRAKAHRRGDSGLGASEHNSLEDIVETLNMFTSRCNILLEPFLKLTEFLSTQTTATAATTKPALTALFLRIILVTPIWVILTLPPLYIITTKRITLAVGTLVLTWHSQPARVTRTIFWRSKSVRHICATLTGLDFTGPLDALSHSSGSLGPRRKSAHEIAAALAAKRESDEPAIQFTFTVYENQRRWLLVGWTPSMLAYERSAWTDEHQNSTSPVSKFELPEVEGGHARWEWLEDSSWHVLDMDGAVVENPSDPLSEGGWIYYDNKWQNGRKGKDGWGKYTRRRRWCRDAQLVEVSQTDNDPLSRMHGENTSSMKTPTKKDLDDSSGDSVRPLKEDDESMTSTRRRRAWFSRRSSQPNSEKSAALSSASQKSPIDNDEEDVHIPLSMKQADKGAAWGMADDTEMLFG